MEFGFGFGFGMGIGASFSPSLAAASASVHPTNYGTNSPAYLYGLPSAGTSRVDDLLDFSGHDVYSSAAASENHTLQHPRAALVGEPGFSYNSHSHSHASSFADEIYIPSEEAAELEWLSKFVEDSFTDTPLYPSTYLPTAAQIKTEQTTNDATAAAGGSGRGTRSRRPRSPQLPNQSSSSSSTSSSSSSDFPQQMHGVDNGNNHASHSHIRGGGDGVRRCTHCSSEKTPQWRTGPLGPKTLCNACGVRYKSGRLVPEYRPAASPTFVLTQHSNSHRKVVELRRQKEQLHGIVRHENHSSNY